MSNEITTTTPTLPNSFAKEFSSKSLELLGTLGHATVTQAEVMLPLAKSLIADGIVYTDLFSPDGGAVETRKQSTCTAEWFHGYLKDACVLRLCLRIPKQRLLGLTIISRNKRIQSLLRLSVPRLRSRSMLWSLSVEIKCTLSQMGLATVRRTMLESSIVGFWKR